MICICHIIIPMTKHVSLDRNGQLALYAVLKKLSTFGQSYLQGNFTFIFWYELKISLFIEKEN